MGGAVALVQVVLGSGLGVAGAGLTVLIVAAILSILAITDATDPDGDASTDDGGYDRVVCVVCALAVSAAAGLLYLPLPWGGICAAAVVVGLAVSLRCV